MLNGLWVYVGSPSDLYDTSDSLSVDSAAAVIAQFTLKDNLCVAESRSVVRVFFSEAVRLPLVVDREHLETSFTRVTASDTSRKLESETIFSVSQTEGLNDIYTECVLSDVSTGGYLFEIVPGKEGSFKQSITKIRLNMWPTLPGHIVVDMYGNSCFGRANRWAYLDAEPGYAPLSCQQFNPTAADRFDGLWLRWGKQEGVDGLPEAVPLFPWWGDELTNPYSDNNLLPPPDPVISIHIFDLFGNLVADPVSNPSLSVELNADDLWLQADGTYASTVSLDYSYLKDCHNDYSNCIPVWNCVNSKGRLVAPGGYIVKKVINNKVDPPEESTLKLIITSRAKDVEF